jgi:hypothetical protein
MASSEAFIAAIAPLVQSRGYKGSGSTLRKVEGDVVFVVNFQRSRDGAHFFVNLGGQPTRIPDEGNDYPNHRTLTEYKCVFRDRVGKEWPRALSSRDTMALRGELDRALVAFEKKILCLSDSIRSEPASATLNALPFGCTSSRAALHLARLSKAMGEPAKCRSFVELGLSAAGSGATGLIEDLRKLGSDLP